MALSINLPRINPFWLLAFALGLALAYAASGFMFIQEQPTTGQTISEKDSTSVRSDNKERMQLIEQRNILGLYKPPPPQEASKKVQAQKKPAPPPPPPPPPPGPDPKDWILVGTFIGEKSFALITIGQESEFLFIQNKKHDWLLSSIEPEKVRFEKGNESRELVLFSETESESKMRQRAETPATKPKAKPQSKQTSSGELVPGKTTRSTLSAEMASEVLNDPEQLLKQAMFKPFKEPGLPNGFRVSRIDPKSLLRKVGLRNNDVLVRVNGQDIDGPAKLMEVYQGLKNANSVSLDVIRGRRLDSILVVVE